MRGLRLPAVALALLALGLAGCGFSNPYQTTSTTTHAAARDDAGRRDARRPT